MKMSIRTRITITVGGGLLALLMINVIGVVRMREVNQQLRAMTEVNSVKQRYAINFRGSVHDRSIRVRDYVLLGNASDRKAVLSEIEELEQFYLESEQLLNQMIASDASVTQEERDMISAEMRGDNANAKVDISRNKGLGEMDPEELWDTTMDPTKRTLKRITLEDAAKADEIFTLLMGEKVEPRREYIENNAKFATNLDY
jgi:DNA gyrase/topoisomerase IV subunit B